MGEVGTAEVNVSKEKRRKHAPIAERGILYIMKSVINSLQLNNEKRSNYSRPEQGCSNAESRHGDIDSIRLCADILNEIVYKYDSCERNAEGGVEVEGAARLARGEDGSVTDQESVVAWVNEETVFSRKKRPVQETESPTLGDSRDVKRSRTNREDDGLLENEKVEDLPRSVPIRSVEQVVYSKRNELDKNRIRAVLAKHRSKKMKWTLAPVSVYYIRQWEYASTPREVYQRCPLCNQMENDPDRDRCQRPKMYKTLKDHLLKSHILEVPYEYKVEEDKETCRECGVLLTKKHFKSHDSRTNCSTWLRYIYYKTLFPHFVDTQIIALIKKDQKELVLRMVDLYGDEKLKSVRKELENVQDICEAHSSLDRSVFEYKMDELAPVRTHDLKSFGLSGNLLEQAKEVRTKEHSKIKVFGEIYDGFPVTYEEVLQSRVLPAMMAECWLQGSKSNIDKLMALQEHNRLPEFKRYRLSKFSDAVMALPEVLRVMDDFQAKLVAQDDVDKEREIAVKKFVDLDFKYRRLFKIS